MAEFIVLIVVLGIGWAIGSGLKLRRQDQLQNMHKFSAELEKSLFLEINKMEYEEMTEDEFDWHEEYAEKHRL